jgi:iron complex outermembrane receptor protein
MIMFIWVLSVLGFGPIEQDTVSLSEVEVFAPSIERFAQGQKVFILDKTTLEVYKGRSLGDLLQEQTGIFVRQYGAGMLASPALRGTSAGHTAVFWNGIPINSPSLGQSDFSILPIQAIDQASIQYGNAGALVGNEAIGGSIHLLTQPSFGKGFSASFSQQVGSFGLFNTSIRTDFSAKKFSSQTRIYRETAENDFKFKDLAQAGTPIIRQTHAAFHQQGIVQDLAWNLSAKAQIKSSLWWNQADREIQPLIGSATRDIQNDASLRAVLDYSYFAPNSTFQLKTGIVRDQQRFNQIQNITTQSILSVDWDHAYNPHWTFKIGTRATYALGELSTYRAEDQRIELYQSTRFLPSEKLSFAVNLRQLFYDQSRAPFAPSIGMDWKIWETENQTLELKASSAKGFKVPTLNDRFWIPGGNLNLIPEESISGEIGAKWTKKSKINLIQNLSYYRMQVQNWIIWTPVGNFWSPQNIREVSNQGLEYEGKISSKTRNWNWESSVSYTFSKAISTQESPLNEAAIGQQLPYTPRHQAQMRFSGEREGWTGFLSVFYVGERNITAGSTRPLPSFQVWNVGIGYQNLQIGKLKLPIRFQILNVLNTDYQVLYLRAMPGRTYQLNFSIQL